MAKTREQILEERRRLRMEYGDLFDTISGLLFRAHPVGISFDNENRDEYDPEAGTIVPRLKACKSAEDVLRVMHEEYVHWFDLATAGSREHYQQVASEIWQIWQERTRCDD
jgi:hypothetical protein